MLKKPQPNQTTENLLRLLYKSAQLRIVITRNFLRVTLFASRRPTYLSTIPYKKHNPLLRIVQF